MSQPISHLLTETPIPFSEAAAQRRVDPATIYRWWKRGVLLPGGGSRVHLEAFRMGAKMFTTAESIVRFFSAQNPTAATYEPVESSDPNSNPPSNSTVSRRRKSSAAEEAARELEAMGA